MRKVHWARQEVKGYIVTIEFSYKCISMFLYQIILILLNIKHVDYLLKRSVQLRNLLLFCGFDLTVQIKIYGFCYTMAFYFH